MKENSEVSVCFFENIDAKQKASLCITKVM